MDAFELLKEDHRKVSALFKEIESAADHAISDLFAQLKSELDLHANLEETIFYPALENSDQAREITLEAYEEHKVVKDLLAELDAALPPDEQWSAKLTVLKENVEHHVEEEEGELFKKARQALSDEEIEELGDQLDSAKAAAGATAVATSKTRGTAKARPATASSKKSGARKGLLGTLAEIVGLGGGSQSSRGTQKASSRSAAKSAGKAAGKSSKKAAAKSGGKKAVAKKSAKASKKAGAKKSAAKRAAKKGASKGGSKRAAVKSRPAALKRSSSKKGGKKASAKKR